MKKTLLVGFVLLLLTHTGTISPPLYASPPPAQPGAWSRPVNISGTPGKSWIPAIATDKAGHVHVVWGEHLDDDGDVWADAIYYTMSDGQTWSPPNDILVSPNGPTADLPAIAVDSRGLIHVVWESRPGIYYSNSWAGGTPWEATAWSQPTQISKAGRGRAYIAIGPEDVVHLVWLDAPETPSVLEGELCLDCWDVHYANSTDGGQSWSVPTNVSNSPERSEYPFVMADSQGAIHVAWDEHNARDQGLSGRYSRSVDGGATWSEPLDIGREVAPAIPTRLFVGPGERGRIYLTWQLWHAPGLFIRRSSNGGATWSSAVELPEVEGRSDYSFLETAADGSDNLFLTFSTGSYSNREVYCGRWANGAWIDLTNVSGSAAHSSRPRIAVSEGNIIHLVWFEHSQGQATIHDGGNMEVFYSRLTSPARHEPPQALPTQPAPTSGAESDPSEAATSPPQETAPPSLSPSPPAGLATPTGIPNTTLPLMVGVAAALLATGLAVLVWFWRNRR